MTALFCLDVNVSQMYADTLFSPLLLYRQTIKSTRSKPDRYEVLLRSKKCVKEDKLLFPELLLSHLKSIQQPHVLDLWVLDQVLKLRGDDQIEYSVNICAGSLIDPAAIFLREFFRRYEEHPEKLIGIGFEITEDASVTHLYENPYFQKFKNLLRSAGCRISLDDYAGDRSCHSPADMFQTFQHPTIKIDKARIWEMEWSDRAFNRVELICKQAHNEGCEVVAEGISNSHLAGMAIAAGCDWLQGFHYHVPSPIPNPSG